MNHEQAADHRLLEIMRYHHAFVFAQRHAHPECVRNSIRANHRGQRAVMARLARSH